jgi:hypothetical protein
MPKRLCRNIGIRENTDAQIFIPAKQIKKATINF